MIEAYARVFHFTCVQSREREMDAVLKAVLDAFWEAVMKAVMKAFSGLNLNVDSVVPLSVRAALRSEVSRSAGLLMAASRSAGLLMAASRSAGLLMAAAQTAGLAAPSALPATTVVAAVGAAAAAAYMIARRFRISHTEFLLMAAGLACMLAISAPGRRCEAFMTAQNKAVDDKLLSSLENLIEKKEDSWSAEGEAGAEAEVEVEVELKPKAYANDFHGDQKKFNEMKLQYKRIQLFLCRLQSYDAGTHDLVIGALAAKAPA
jgi:hypothetical protein